tara:strand:- start:158 stop:526 length:369 start_codon:yes stop_codon:yes gene_type:complete
MSSSQTNTPTQKSHAPIASKGGKGKFSGKGGKAGPKRFGKVGKEPIMGCTKPAIRRLCRRGGIKRIDGLFYDETRGVVKWFIDNIVKDALNYTEHARRKTISVMDIIYALKRQGRTLYGYGG